MTQQTAMREGVCDVCQKPRLVTRAEVTGIETFACDECRGVFEPCGHCGGETLEDCRMLCPVFVGAIMEPCHGEAP